MPCEIGLRRQNRNEPFSKRLDYYYSSPSGHMVLRSDIRYIEEGEREEMRFLVANALIVFILPVTFILLGTVIFTLDTVAGWFFVTVGFGIQLIYIGYKMKRVKNNE